jgi:hypothetical protein
MDAYETQAIRIIRKAIDNKVLPQNEAQDLLELFREEAGEHSPCYAYNNLEGDLQSIVANGAVKKTN